MKKTTYTCDICGLVIPEDVFGAPRADYALSFDLVPAIDVNGRAYRELSDDRPNAIGELHFHATCMRPLAKAIGWHAPTQSCSVQSDKPEKGICK